MHIYQLRAVPEGSVGNSWGDGGYRIRKTFFLEIWGSRRFKKHYFIKYLSVALSDRNFILQYLKTPFQLHMLQYGLIRWHDDQLNDDLIWFKSSGIRCWEYWQTVYDVPEERVAFVVSVVQHTLQSQTRATNNGQEKRMGHYFLGNLRITVFFKFWSFFLDGPSKETAFSSPLNFRAKYTLFFIPKLLAVERTTSSLNDGRPCLPLRSMIKTPRKYQTFLRYLITQNYADDRKFLISKSVHSPQSQNQANGYRYVAVNP